MGSLRMLMSSNAMWAKSGYGVQSASLLPRLAKLSEFDGIENIAQFAWYGLSGAIHTVNGIRIYPAGTDPYGNDVIGAHTKHFNANIVVSLIDVWVMHDTANKIKPALWLPWTPIDHQPIPQRVIDSLKGCHTCLSYSKWGASLLTQAGVENTYIPHGIEPAVYRVNEDIETVRRFKRDMFGPACEHLTIMVAANKGYPDRKAFQVQMRAWAAFAKDKPAARLYLHTEALPTYGGLDLPTLATNLGIADRVIFPDRYNNYLGMPAEYLAMCYNAADVFMGNSMAEGFGIPIIESQACGLPAVVTDFSAMPELVRWGYKIPPADMFWTPMNSWQAWPDVHGIQDALEELYTQWHAQGNQWTHSQKLKVSAKIHEEFDWDAIVRDQWAPLMTRLAGEAPPLAQPTQSVQAPKPERNGHEPIKRYENRLQRLPVLRVEPDGSVQDGNTNRYEVSIITPWLDHPELISDYEQAVRGAEVIVIDNGSLPENAARLRAMVDRLGGRLLRNEDNRMFAYANNQGLVVATKPIVLFLNNDIVAENDWLRQIEQFVREKALYGPSLMAQNIAQRRLPYIEGWCIAALRSVWDALDGWDAENYKGLYWEDVDLAWRAQQSGYSLIQTSWPIRHLNNTTSRSLPGAYDHSDGNRNVLAKKIHDVYAQPIDNRAHT